MDLKALYSISYGLFVIASKDGDRLNGQIANTVFQISSDPPTIAISINKQNLTHEFIMKSGLFTVSILDEETPLSLIGHFGFKSGREVDKFSEIKYQLTPQGLPYLVDNTLAYIEAKVIKDVDAGTHTIFIGEITGAEVLKQGNPMTYAYYHRVKRGSTPPAAPTYIKDNKENIISFRDAKKYATNSYLNKFTGFINKGLLSILRSFKKGNFIN